MDDNMLHDPQQVDVPLDSELTEGFLLNNIDWLVSNGLITRELHLNFLGIGRPTEASPPTIFPPTFSAMSLEAIRLLLMLPLRLIRKLRFQFALQLSSRP